MGARYYDPIIARWNTPDPLNEHDYDYAVKNSLNEEIEQEGLDVDAKTTEDLNGYINKYLESLGPINLTANNSAIHYGASLYGYVLGNPISYVDPFGLDTLKPVTVIGYTKPHSDIPPWWWGPALIGLGQPLDVLKPRGALGSEPGSSIASKILSKALPFTSRALKRNTRKVVAKVVGKQIAKRVGTAVVGRFIGRLVPYVDWVFLAKDAWDYRKEIGAFIRNMQEENEANKDNALWHVH
ncbi:MAG: hypothetical protein C5B59_16635 [Bacteroidetes bacterium]|nr:MAG: hypothetical protein C5B59_16635 [Bacteroidota bacterium]